MRRIPALATVSTLALGIAISIAAGSLFAMPVTAQAAEKIARLGTLMAEGNWTVGTVNGKRDTYCATVNSFKGGTAEGDVVLAVARDPDGYGSLAFDFSQKFFKPGNDYEATVTPGGGKPRNLRGRATTEKSLIVQVGTDEAFFKSMVGNTIVIATPVLEGTFGLGAFEDAYKKLVNCSTQLNDPSSKVAAAAVEDVQKASLAPIDRAAAEIGKKGQYVKVAVAETKPANALDDMEAQLDKDAKAEEAKVKAATAKADAAQKEINDKIEDSKKDVARLETQKKSVERKLLMSTSNGGAPLPVVPTATVATVNPTAMELEKQQIEALKARKGIKAETPKEVAVETAKTASKDDVKLAAKDLPVKEKAAEKVEEKPPAVVIAKVEEKAPEKVEEKKAEEKKPVAVVETKTAEPEKKADSIVWSSAPEVAKPIPAPDLSTRLAAAEKSNTDAKTRLAAQEAKNQKAESDLKEKQNSGKKIQLSTKDAKAKKAKQEKELAELRRRNKNDTVALKREAESAEKYYNELKKEQGPTIKLADASPAPTPSAIAAPVSAPPAISATAPVAVSVAPPTEAPAPIAPPPVKAVGPAKPEPVKDDSALIELKNQLAQKDAQNEALKKELDTAKTEKPKVVVDPAVEAKYSKLNDDLTQKQKAMADLEAKMKAIDEERAAETARAAKAQAELEAARLQLAEMKKASIEKAANERLASDTAALQAAMALNKERDVPKVKVEVAPEPVAPAPAPIPKTEVAVAKPAPTVLPDETAVPTPAPVTGNKAEAFLDKIMAAHHIKSASPEAHDIVADVKKAEPKTVLPPVVAKVEPTVVPVAEELSKPAAVETKTVVATTVVPDTVSAKAAPAVAVAAAPEKEKTSFFGRMKNILPGKKETPAVQPPNDYPDASGIPAFAGGGITLEKLLGYSGTERVNFVSVTSQPGEVVRQWTSDNIDGLYEQFPAASNMEAQVKSYIDRYRQDCQRSLTVTLKEPRVIAAGMMVIGNMTCADQGNSYATSFVFLEAQDVFHALLHTGYQEDLADLKRISDNIGLTLSRASQFLAPQPAMKKPLRRPLPLTTVDTHAEVDDVIREDSVKVAPPAKIAPPVNIPAPMPVKKAEPVRTMPQLPLSRTQPSATVSSDEFGTVVIE